MLSNKMLKAQNVAYAKIVKNNKLNMLRMLVAVNVYDDCKITVRNAAYISSDLISINANATQVSLAIATAVAQAKAALHVNKIKFVNYC